jgi:hypothetical protein
MLPLLALLLIVGTPRFSGAHGALQVPERAVEEVLANPGERGLDVEAGAVLAQHGVGVLDVGGREGLDGILEGGESGDDLCPH